MVSGSLLQVGEHGLANLKAPLISDQSVQTVDTDESDENETKAGGFPSLVSFATALLVIGGVTTSGVAMVSVAGADLASKIVMYVAGWICTFESSWVALKQYQISKGLGIRKTVNLMRDKLGLLEEEESILSISIDDLEEEVECLNDIQQELHDLVHEQGMNVDEVIALVNENEAVLQQMKNYLRQAALADVTRIVIASDRNNDMSINLKELKMLTLRVKLRLEEHGVDLDEQQSMALVRKDNDISQVLRVIGAIMFEEETIDGKSFDEYLKEAHEEEDRQNELVGSLFGAGTTLGRMRNLSHVGGIDLEAVLRDDDSERKYSRSRSTAVISASMIARLGRLAALSSHDNDEEDEGDMAAPMFTLQERFTRGSVAAARGNSRTSLSRKTRQQGGRSKKVMRRASGNIHSSEIIQSAIWRGTVGQGTRRGFAQSARPGESRDLGATI